MNKTEEHIDAPELMNELESLFNKYNISFFKMELVNTPFFYKLKVDDFGGFCKENSLPMRTSTLYVMLDECSYSIANPYILATLTPREMDHALKAAEYTVTVNHILNETDFLKELHKTIMSYTE